MLKISHIIKFELYNKNFKFKFKYHFFNMFQKELNKL